MLLVVDGEQHVAVARLEQIGGGPAAHRLIAGQLLTMAGHGVVRDLSRQERHRRLQHGDVDQLPLAGVGALEQRARNAERGGGARKHVADGEAGARRPGLFVTGDRHDAGHRLDLAVIAGGRSFRAGLAEAGDGAIDQPRIDRRQRLIADAELVHHAGPEILHHHVGLGGEPLDDRDRLRLLQVERQAALVAVDCLPAPGQGRARPIRG